jgi:hypothetical protein
MAGRTLLAFLLGVAVGVAGTIAVGRREPPPEAPRAVVRMPTPTEKAAVKAAFDRITLDPQQRNALYLAGRAMQEGKRPLEALPPDAAATLRAIAETIRTADCTAAGDVCDVYRVDVIRCFNDSARVIEQRKKDRATIPYDLFHAAVGAWAVNADQNLHSIFHLTEHCRLLAVALVEHPPRDAG